MSATTDDSRTLTELLRMDEQTAKRELSYAEYQTWESATDHHGRYQERKREWRENEQQATDILVNTDVSALATEIELFGNDVAVYYDPEDPRLHDAAEAVADVLGVDIDDAADIEATTNDVPREAIDDAKGALAELVCVTFVEWNGHNWSDLPAESRRTVVERIQQSRPDGWGLAGLMDAFSEIMTAVETNRNERLERVEKFRNPERRGNR